MTARRTPTPQELFANEILDRAEEAMSHAGIDPAYAYAMRKTGRIVTTENQHLLTKADIQEWKDAVEEYRSADSIVDELMEEIRAEQKKD